MPPELSREIAIKEGFKISNNFESELKVAKEKHQEISRVGAKKKFGGIGEGADYEAQKLHTATHLLLQALREALGDHVQQMGSDITSQRLRFDFSHSQKMTKEDIKRVEDLVNQKIKEDLSINKEKMSYEEAVKKGALAFFKEKYPKEVTVYSINDFSKEICGGPHVKRTSELGVFKIIKEESSGSGVRRIRAVLKSN
jgi:alanyl-tRNA synthetase